MKAAVLHLALLAALLAGAPTTLHADHHVVAKGTFSGRNDHVVKGTATIEKTEKGYVVVLSRDFSLDGAPDPKVGFGKDGYKKEAKLAPLAKKTGEQRYPVKKAIDPTRYNEVWIWCERFDVPLGVAKLKPAKK